MPKAELDAAVAEAAAEIDKQLELEKPEEQEAEVEVELTEEESEDEEEEEEFSSSEADEARRLYLALKDPKTSKAVIAALAQQNGLLDKPEPSTEKGREREVKSITTIFKEALGKEYDFLADRLAPAVEAVLSQEREQTEVRFREAEAHRIETAVVSATDKLNRDTKGESRKFENRMASLSEEVPVGNMDIDTYVKRLYHLARAETNGQPASPKKTSDRIRQNANNAADRLKGASRMAPEPKIPDRKMSITESVNFALGELSKRT